MERLTPQQVRERLRLQGIEVTLEQAAAILVFLRNLANIAIAQCLREEGERMERNS